MRISKFLVVTVLTLAMTGFSSSVNAASLSDSGSTVNIKSNVLGEKSFTGLIVKGHTYVDLDGFVNCLPFQINSKALSFQSETKTFKVLNKDFAIPTPELQFKVGSETFQHDGESFRMNSPVLLIQNRIYFPLKDVVSVYDIHVSYDSQTKKVQVSKE
ncbi:copper amine oxidase N-terminal domain-containing protein [Paenibacillus polysaccharolyticus]|uniref:stalk domain-containing protein n=1 Tax=Paenibacillus polysaccharolyticus TaxID=582692 RepID=UPI00209E0FF6|nr:stalk domain-containing protein [Paenibacillus polysaccharolyticus]MCP1132887.1 copper amine oxidase N-terminal domain-containing protein [Paenibacillus polysaccharolyticus]